MVVRYEQFCKDRAVHNTVLDGIKILDNKDKKKNTEAMLLFYQRHLQFHLIVILVTIILVMLIEDLNGIIQKKKYQFDLNYFNKITKGGVPAKTLNVALAGTGVGKSLFMCHCASSYLTQGYNVLYITLEMAEEKIAERIDANVRFNS